MQTQVAKLSGELLDSLKLPGVVVRFGIAALGFGQIGPRLVGHGWALLFRGRQNQGDGAFDFSSGKLLFGHGDEQPHLQGLRQTTELLGAHRSDLRGLYKGLEIFTQALHEPQPTQNPVLAPP